MIKAAILGAGGAPVLIFAITPEDARLLADGQCVSTAIRSRSGIEAFLLVGGGPSDEALLEKFRALGATVAEVVPVSDLADLSARIGEMVR